MAFGFRRRGLFGGANRVNFGNIFDDVALGVPPPTTPPIAPDERRARLEALGQPKSPGFFGEGGTGRAIAGLLGDYLLQDAGLEPIYTPAMQMQAFARQRAMLEDQKRRWAIEDYEKKKKIDAQYAQPDVDEFDRAMIRAGIHPGSPEYNEFARQYAERKAAGADPFLQNAPLPGGGVFTGPFSKYSEIVNGTGPARPVGKLRRVGDAGSNASGGFRR